MSAPLAITEDAVLQCDHLAKLENKPSQNLFTIESKRVLVARDPEGRAIHGCPNLTPVTKPCLLSLTVDQGYSTFVRVDGHAVCLSTVKGHTDGSPPGGFFYVVKDPGQVFVTIAQ